MSITLNRNKIYQWMLGVEVAKIIASPWWSWRITIQMGKTRISFFTGRIRKLNDNS